MPLPDFCCPVCDADLALSGDEQPGDQVYCSYCTAVSVVVGKPNSKPDDWSLEENF